MCVHGQKGIVLRHEDLGEFLRQLHGRCRLRRLDEILDRESNIAKCTESQSLVGVVHDFGTQNLGYSLTPFCGKRDDVGSVCLFSATELVDEFETIWDAEVRAVVQSADKLELVHKV